MDNTSTMAGPTEKDVLITLNTWLHWAGSEDFTKMLSLEKLNKLCKDNHIDAVVEDGKIISFKKIPRVPKFKIELKIVQLGQDEEKEPHSIDE